MSDAYAGCRVPGEAVCRFVVRVCVRRCVGVCVGVFGHAHAARASFQ